MEQTTSVEGSLSQTVVEENRKTSAEAKCAQTVSQSVETICTDNRKVTTAKFSSSQSFSSEEFTEYAEVEEDA